MTLPSEANLIARIQELTEYAALQERLGGNLNTNILLAALLSLIDINLDGDINIDGLITKEEIEEAINDALTTYGPSTQATLEGLLSRIPTLGQKASSGSISVVPSSGSDLATQTTLAAILTALLSASDITGAVVDAIQLESPISVENQHAQPLTDAQLRDTPISVSGTVTADTGLTQPLTDAQLRATAVPVSASSLPLPTGAATATAQSKLLGSLTGNLTAAANATNDAAIATIAAPGAGNYTQLTDIYFGYSAAPSAGATLTVSATGVMPVVLPITSAGPGPIRFPLRVPNDVAATITLSAGGSGVVGYVAAIYSTQAV